PTVDGVQPYPRPVLDALLRPPVLIFSFFFSSRRRHTMSKRDWSSDVCSSDLNMEAHYPKTFASFLLEHQVKKSNELLYVRPDSLVPYQSYSKILYNPCIHELDVYYTSSSLFDSVQKNL